MARPTKEVTRPLLGAIPVPAVPAVGRPRRQVTGGVDLPGLDEIIEEARRKHEGDMHASSPPPAALADLPPTDPQENILTSPFIARVPPVDHIDLDSMVEDDLRQTAPVAPGALALPDEELGAEAEVDPGDDDGPRGIEVWRVVGEDGPGGTKADILRRIRAGELGPQDCVAAADGPDDERCWELAQVPEFKRYVMLFGRTGTSGDAARRPFWKRFKKP